MAKCDILLETSDASWELSIDFSIVSALLFKKKYPPPPALPESNDSKDGSPYEAFGELKHQELLWYYWRMAHNGSDVASTQAL